MTFTAFEVIEQAKQGMTPKLINKFEFIMEYFNMPRECSLDNLIGLEREKLEKIFEMVDFPKNRKHKPIICLNYSKVEFKFYELNELDNQKLNEMISRSKKGNGKINRNILATEILKKGLCNRPFLGLIKRYSRLCIKNPLFLNNSSTLREDFEELIGGQKITYGHKTKQNSKRKRKIEPKPQFNANSLKSLHQNGKLFAGERIDLDNLSKASGIRKQTLQERIQNANINLRATCNNEQLDDFFCEIFSNGNHKILFEDFKTWFNEINPSRISSFSSYIRALKDRFNLNYCFSTSFHKALSARNVHLSSNNIITKAVEWRRFYPEIKTEHDFRELYNSLPSTLTDINSVANNLDQINPVESSQPTSQTNPEFFEGSVSVPSDDELPFDEWSDLFQETTKLQQDDWWDVMNNNEGSQSCYVNPLPSSLSTINMEASSRLMPPETQASITVPSDDGLPFDVWMERFLQETTKPEENSYVVDDLDISSSSKRLRTQSNQSSHVVYSMFSDYFPNLYQQNKSIEDEDALSFSSDFLYKN